MATKPAPAPEPASSGRGHGDHEHHVLPGHHEQVGRARRPSKSSATTTEAAAVVAEHEAGEQRPLVGRAATPAPSITSERMPLTSPDERRAVVDGRHPVGDQPRPDVAGRRPARVGEGLDATLDLDPLPRLTAAEPAAGPAPGAQLQAARRGSARRPASRRRRARGR